MASEFVVVERADVETAARYVEDSAQKDRYEVAARLRAALSAEAVQAEPAAYQCPRCLHVGRNQSEAQCPCDDRDPALPPLRPLWASLPQPVAGERPTHAPDGQELVWITRDELQAYEAAPPDVGVAEWLLELAGFVSNPDRAAGIRQAAAVWTRQHPPDAGAGEKGR